MKEADPSTVDVSIGCSQVKGIDTVDTTPLLTSQELADYCRVPVQTVYTWRHRGMAPSAIRVGRYVRYRWSDVQVWMKQREERAS